MSSVLHRLIKSEPGFNLADSQMVYFVQAKTEDAPIKIGITWDLAHRIGNLRTASPYEIELLGTVLGGKDRERAIHARFAHLRIRGEWFRSEPELLEFIEATLSHREAS